MFLDNYTWIQKQRVKVHMVVLQMLQLNIMFKTMTWHLLMRQLFYHYKTFTLAQFLSRLFWALFQSLEISFLEWKNRTDETPSTPKWDYQTCLLFKTFILKNKDRLSLMHIGKKMIHDQDRSTSVYQFQVLHMTHTMLKT